MTRLSLKIIQWRIRRLERLERISVLDHKQLSTYYKLKRKLEIYSERPI